MKKQKLTPWFPVRLRPARIGLYEARYPERPSERCFRIWDGRTWRHPEGNASLFGIDQNDKWRGLAHPPK